MNGSSSRCHHVLTNRSTEFTAMRGRRDGWRTQTDSNAVVPWFSRRAATPNVPTLLVEGAHDRSCRFVCLPFRPLSFLAILRRARSYPPRRTASGRRLQPLDTCHPPLYGASSTEAEECDGKDAKQGVEK